MKYRHHTMLVCSAALAAALCCGCQDTIGPETVEESRETEFTFRLTKAGDDNATVSAYLFNAAQAKALNQGTEGRYFVSGTALVPGSIPGTRDSSYGLRATNGSYTLSLASPATPLSQIGTSAYYGIHYSREMAEPLFFSSPESVSLSGIYLDGEYEHQVATLMERRSKIKVTVKCGDKVPSVILHSVTLTSLFDSGWYLPQTGEFYHSGDTDSFVDLATDILPVTILPGESVTSSEEVWVISQDYSSLDEYGQPLYVLPHILVKLGETGDVQADIPLNDDFPAQCTLHYTININSVTAAVILSVLPWDGVSVDGDIDEQPTVEETIIKEEWYPVSIPVNEGTIE